MRVSGGADRNERGQDGGEEGDERPAVEQVSAGGAVHGSSFPVGDGDGSLSSLAAGAVARGRLAAKTRGRLSAGAATGRDGPGVRPGVGPGVGPGSAGRGRVCTVGDHLSGAIRPGPDTPRRRAAGRAAEEGTGWRRVECCWRSLRVIETADGPAGGWPGCRARSRGLAGAVQRPGPGELETKTGSSASLWRASRPAITKRRDAEFIRRSTRGPPRPLPPRASDAASERSPPYAV